MKKSDKKDTQQKQQQIKKRQTISKMFKTTCMCNPNKKL